MFAVATIPSLDVISCDPSPISKPTSLALMIMAAGIGTVSSCSKTNKSDESQQLVLFSLVSKQQFIGRLGQ